MRSTSVALLAALVSGCAAYDGRGLQPRWLKAALQVLHDRLAARLEDEAEELELEVQMETELRELLI